MKLSLFLSTLVSTLTTAQYTNQSAPFQLLVISSNSTLNGTALAACHEGAAIEGLCPAGALSPSVPSASTTYVFNTSSTSSNDPLGDDGYLIWSLTARGANDTIVHVPEPLTLTQSATSNIAIPLFYPSTSNQLVAFDKDDLLTIHGYVDDSVSPPVHAEKAYYNWYICTTYYTYTYQTLAWTVGNDNATPENPTCQKVSVKRVWNTSNGYVRR